MSPTPLPNALTVDVEEWFQVSAFEAVLERERWDAMPSRLQEATARLLDLFDRRGAKATFFVLGCVARRSPEVVREIVRRGHEIASHGDLHRRVDALDPASFREDLARAAEAIDAAAGVRVTGFRAPSFSVSRQTPWAWEVLAEEGYGYSSSVFPVRHDRYGIPDFPRGPVGIATGAGDVVELPMTTWRVLGRTLPAAGGGWLRALPRFVAHRALAAARRAGRPAVVYVHPWEVDPEQPVLAAAPWSSRLRHRLNLGATLERLDDLLGRWPFVPVRDLLPQLHDLPRIGAPGRDPAPVVRA